MKNLSPLALTSAAVGFPARACQITRKDGAVYRFAESDVPFTIDGDTFAVGTGLQISAIKHTSNGDMPSCQIATVHSLGGLFDTGDLDTGLFDSADVQIWTVDLKNLSRKGLLFTGSLANIAYDTDNLVVFDVKGPASGAGILMTQKRSPMCRTDLFSVLCGADKTAFAVTATIASVVDQHNFTVSGLAQSDGYFNQGVAITADGVPFVMGNWVQSTQKVTAYKQTDQILTVGDTITMYPGCDKTLGATGCAKFGRQLNFQGEPHFLGAAAAAQQV